LTLKYLNNFKLIDTGMLCLAPISALLHNSGRLDPLKEIISVLVFVAFSILIPGRLDEALGILESRLLPLKV
jgi:hypothetical protein